MLARRDFMTFGRALDQNTHNLPANKNWNLKEEMLRKRKNVKHQITENLPVNISRDQCQ